MTDVPPDVEEVLGQLFAEAREALGNDDTETAIAAVTSASTVASNKLPEDSLREQVLHGCERVEAVATGDDADPEAAAEYVAAMERRLADSAE